MSIKKKALLVENDIPVLEALKALLESHGGFEIDMVSRGMDAGPHIDRSDYFLIISDYDLEQKGMGGRILQHAKDRNPNTKTFLMSGNHQVVRSFKQLAPAADYFIPKPNIALLIELLKKICK